MEISDNALRESLRNAFKLGYFNTQDDKETLVQNIIDDLKNKISEKPQTAEVTVKVEYKTETRN